MLLAFLCVLCFSVFVLCGWPFCFCVSVLPYVAMWMASLLLMFVLLCVPICCASTLPSHSHGGWVAGD